MPDSTNPEDPATQSSMAAHLPLQGVKIVEIAQNLAGSFCGAILASLGADVIKVEKPTGAKHVIGARLSSRARA